MKGIKLTDEQRNVIKVFMKFLLNPNERYMLIQGAAGTGKTTMIKYMLESIHKQWKLLKGLLCIDPNTEDFNILLTATTNKAAAVLTDLSGDPTVRTVHSTLGLTLQKDYSTGQEYLKKNKRFETLHNTILILDEGSMLDDATTEFLDEALGPTSKAVIIGDVYQLAPVNQRLSAMQKMLHQHPTAVMSTVMRHGGPILEAATAFRDVVQNGVFQDILLSDKVIHVDGLTFHDEVKKAFLHPRYSPSRAKILAWSNGRVQDYNAHLRQLKSLGTSMQEGELVVTNKPIIAGGHIIPVDSEVEITYLGAEIEKFEVTGRRVELDGKVSAFLPNNYQDAQKLMKRIAKEARAADKAGDNILRKELWTHYFNIKDCWLDLRDQFASTVHKSQGSSCDEVFIDLYDIGRCNMPSDVARLLYVAISRARKRVIMTGELPPKYCGQMAA